MSLPPRVVPPLLACALCLSSCLWVDDAFPRATGECRGTHQGRRVRWPIEEQSSLVHRAVQGELPDTFIDLDYTPEDEPVLEGFGVDIHLVEDARVEADRTVNLFSRQGRLVPAEPSLVTAWVGNIGEETGYLSVPGVPLEGSVTLDEVSPWAAQGRFVYRYSDGGELTCTFDVLEASEE
ncbi:MULTISPECIES: hypothetical protein [unclassified Corallococcus]|uniref:hypothetical protein n=1 Tax=unclassified Corallococcus TaxID=2685029 RepID=UPI001A8C0AB7|nr:MULTISPECIES: hypothetical protein [unclassified Corallococcus]MBN9682742.1 hypothetical protein [Corallococcus sp. NCSPR001]WAS85717.1 hypothetical protein O0N60_01800 [Corallococcus sp. NCRR]